MDPVTRVTFERIARREEREALHFGWLRASLRYSGANQKDP